MQTIPHRLPLLVLFCFLFLYSCRSKNVTCSDGAISIHPVGFTDTDFDSAKVIKYAQGSSFSAPVDTSLAVRFTSNGWGPDTGIFYAYSDTGRHPIFILPGYDYKIILPAVGRTFSISNITQSGQTHQTISKGLFDGKDYVCYNGIVHLTLDGTTYTGTNGQQTLNVVLIK